MCSKMLTMKDLYNSMRSKGGAQQNICGDILGRIANVAFVKTELMLNLKGVEI